MAGAERGQQRLGCMVALFLVAKVAMSAEPTAEERLFDQPQAVQDFDPIEGPHPTVALRCHWYGDLMIRETQTDSPGFGPAYVVYGNAGGARPVCRSAPTARDTKLNLQEQTCLAEKGPTWCSNPRIHQAALSNSSYCTCQTESRFMVTVEATLQ